MRYEIDQSGKVEETSKPTVLSLSNGDSISICIPAKVKRKIQEEFRKLGEPHYFVLVTFVASVSLLLKLKNSKFLNVIIDTEYPGKEDFIGGMLKDVFNDNILLEFKEIGKSCNAHEIALNVFRGKQSPTKTITTRELLLETKRYRDPRGGRRTLKDRFYDQSASTRQLS